MFDVVLSTQEAAERTFQSIVYDALEGMNVEGLQSVGFGSGSSAPVVDAALYDATVQEVWNIYLGDDVDVAVAILATKKKNIREEDVDMAFSESEVDEVSQEQFIVHFFSPLFNALVEVFQACCYLRLLLFF